MCEFFGDNFNTILKKINNYASSFKRRTFFKTFENSSKQIYWDFSNITKKSKKIKKWASYI